MIESYDHFLLAFEQEINYWKSSSGHEADFVLREGSKVVRIIQVCYALEEEATKKREVDGLVRAAKEFGIQEGTIISKDVEKSEENDGVKINYMPLWKFLLHK